MKLTKKEVIIGSGILLGFSTLIYFLYFNNNNSDTLQDASTMKASNDIKNYIKSKEGLSLKVYLDSGGIPTVGYGENVNGVSGYFVGQTITQQQADDLFDASISKFENLLNNILTGQISQNVFDACMSFIFNTGKTVTDLYTYINNSDLQNASLFLWNPDTQTGHYTSDVRGNQLAGLVSRRQYEAQLILS